MHRTISSSLFFTRHSTLDPRHLSPKERKRHG
jgi:hypothetical protein